MKNSALALITALIATVSYSQRAYDLGLKTSTFNRDRLQLEQRFHLNSNYFLIANFSMGRHLDVYTTTGDVSGDIIVDQQNYQNQNTFFAGKVGIGHKLTFLPTNFFYLGTSLGIGYEEYLKSEDRILMYFDDNGESIHLPTGQPMTQENTQNYSFNSGAFYQLYLTFGMDVPLTKRLFINCEVNGSILHSRNATSAASGLSFIPSVSGGLRYSFGKEIE